ncbi:MAG: ATP-dependent Clp protease ATP-binding subunit, partial [Bacteroidota bacterium]
HILEIIEIMQKDLFARIHELGIEIEVTDAAKAFLVEKGYDPQFGARPLRRAIQKYVEDPMAESILQNDLAEGAHITVDHKKNAEELSFKTKKAKRKKAAPKADAEPKAEAPETEQPASEEQE